MTDELAVGTRVKVTSRESFHYGETGTIKGRASYGMYAVELDYATRLCHDCDGVCAEGRGWWISKENVSILRRTKAKIVTEWR